MFWHVLAPNFTPSHVIKSTGHPHHWREKSNALKVFANSRRSPRWRSQAACLCWRPPLRHVHVSMSSSGSVSLIRPGQTRTDFLAGLMFCFRVNPPEISEMASLQGLTSYIAILCVYFRGSSQAKPTGVGGGGNLHPQPTTLRSLHQTRQGRGEETQISGYWGGWKRWLHGGRQEKFDRAHVQWTVRHGFAESLMRISPFFQREIHRLGNLSVIPSGKLH